MINSYTNDLMTVIFKLSAGLRTTGRVYMVVGDSKYGGIEVPIAQIISELAPSLGYTVNLLEPCRSMRTSPQQGGRHELPETLIVLTKR